jgi:hypothetical protein
LSWLSLTQQSQHYKSILQARYFQPNSLGMKLPSMCWCKKGWSWTVKPVLRSQHCKRILQER